MKTNYQWKLAANGIKRILTGLVLAAGMMVTEPVMAAAYPAPVDLGLCSNFAILAATAVSTDGGTGTISGDVGLSPGAGSSITVLTAAQVNGKIYTTSAGGPAGSEVNAALLNSAQTNLTTAYNDAAGRSVDRIVLTDGQDIGNSTRAPGLYWSATSLYITGDLTLDAGGDPNAVWIFQMGSTLITADGAPGNPASRVILAGGAQARNIFWQVGSSATLGTYSIFKGTVMANVTVTMDVGSSTEGRALARTGAVTFNGGGSGNLPPLLSTQVITNFIPTNSSVFAGTNKVGLSAQASSSLAVTFTVKSGPSTLIGTITGGTNLVFANTGLVSIVASQAGNSSYYAAPSVTNTYTVIPPLPAEPGMLAIQVTPSSGSWRLTVPVGYTGLTAGTGNLTAVSAVIGAYTITYGALSGYMLPTNNNQAQVVIAGEITLFAGVYRQVSTDLAPPDLTATEGTYTNKVQISWPSVSGVTSYEIWRSQTNDIITAIFIAETSGLLYDDTDVVPLRSYYYWGLSKTATQVSPLGLVTMGYASLSPDQNTVADITASDMVFLPVNVTNLTTAGTVSFWLGNLGPYALNSNEVAFDFRMGSNNAAMVLLGTAQRAFSLTAGQEQLVILTAQEKRDLVVPATLGGVKQVQVTVRHLSTLYDPNLANNKTTAAGMVLVRASGVNSPGRSVNDYDGDGKSDGAIYRASDGRWDTVLSGYRYHEWLRAEAGQSGLTPVPGDYDGDGITDIGVYCHLNGWWWAQFSSTEQNIGGYFIGGTDFIAAQCDFDGDAKTDPAVYRETDGTWYGAASSEEYATQEASFGGIGYQPVFGDYDGDGLADPAVYNRESGLWGIALSGSGYQVMAGTFGGSGYLPVSADYNGDGLTDLAIYNPATAYWQVLLSGSAYYTWCGGFAGSINGIPVPADYDGDGITDLAVYHQDTGIWELFFSDQNYQELSGGFGGPEYQPVTE